VKSDLSAKSVILFFVAILALYLAAFYGWEHWQRRLGPWEVEFTTDTQGEPAVEINQSGLKISSLRLVFQGERVAATNLNQRVVFNRVERQGPFGKVIYEDLRSMPGVVTFDFFGHEIELVPRVLVVNRSEVPWKSPQVIELSPTNKPAIAPALPQNRRARPAR